MMVLKKTCKAPYHLMILVFLTLTGLFWVTPGYAKDSSQNCIKEDLNNDGIVDHIAHYDDQGNMTKMEIDSNADGIMDQFQYYQNSTLKRI